MEEIKSPYKEIYFTNNHVVYLLTQTHIERFLSMYIFPITLIPPLGIVFLKEKHAAALNYLSNFILLNNSAPINQPINRIQLFDIISKTLILTGTNINILREYNANEIREWYENKLKDNNIRSRKK